MNNNVIEKFKKWVKNPYVIAITLALLLVVTITATSYAYFTANVTGTGQNTVVTTTSLEIEFTDGPTVSLQNALPGEYVEKTFKVENKGSGDTTYDVYMSDLINGFADKTDLVYTLISNDGGYNVITQTQVPDTNTKIVNAQLLRAGEEHNYTLRITFKETNDNQDDNKGKSFSTIIRINEVKAPSLSVRLHPNEGTLDSNTIDLVVGDSIRSLLPTPVSTRSEYTFANWWLDSNLTMPVTAMTTMTTDIKDLYARYVPVNYSLSYTLNGGSVSNPKNPTSYNVETPTFTLKNPTKNGYNFTGWSGDGTGTEVTINQGSSGDKSFTANWSPITYNITYNYNGGSASSNQTTYNIETNTFTINNPTRSGYYFYDWVGYNNSRSNPVQITKGSTGDKTFTAQWLCAKAGANNLYGLYNSSGNITLCYNGNPNSNPNPNKELPSSYCTMSTSQNSIYEGQLISGGGMSSTATCP